MVKKNFLQLYKLKSKAVWDLGKREENQSIISYLLGLQSGP